MRSSMTTVISYVIYTLKQFRIITDTINHSYDKNVFLRFIYAVKHELILNYDFMISFFLQSFLAAQTVQERVYCDTVVAFFQVIYKTFGRLRVH